ncbi:MAG: rhodanese-like domain-containing protein [Bacteroidota bacterium]|jgi:phage shock protein E
MLQLFKQIFGKEPSIDFKTMVQQGAVIIDVRTTGEYNGGHIKGSLNIPVDRIASKIEEIKKKGKPVITCCRSGARSGMAAGILKKQGIACYNGGTWNSLQLKIK